ncbi:hypothetical protein BGZ73_009092 [Actinomortierella ambigua]|nr:hypothetical protein BGZ73_009092 [Actinomortierella ambigua]
MLPDELLQSQGIPMVNGDKAGKRELWRFVASNNNGHLRITNPSTRLWLVADKQSMADVFGMPKSEASHWRVEAVLGKPYVIIRLGDSEYVWTRLGDRIIVDTYIGHPAQQWTLTPVPEEFGCF